LLHHVAALEVDEVLDAVRLDKLASVFAGVDGDDAVAHGTGVLASEVAEAAPGAGDHHEFAAVAADLLQSLVDGQPSAEHGCGRGQVEVGRDRRHKVSVRHAPLLEGAVHHVAVDHGVGARDLVALAAVLTPEAGASEPLDADRVSDLEAGVGAGAHRSDVARAFVAADQRQLALDALRALAVPDREVRVAHARLQILRLGDGPDEAR
jgi:hypothetical protein